MKVYFIKNPSLLNNIQTTKNIYRDPSKETNKR